MDYINKLANGEPTSAHDDLAGLNLDTSVRFTSLELATLSQKLQKYFGQDTVCIIGACLGGSLEDSDAQGSGLLDNLVSWAHLDSTATTAQTYCKTDLTFKQAVATVRERSPSLADLIVAKRNPAKKAAIVSLDKKEAQDTQKVIDAEISIVKDVGKAITTTLDFAPWALAAGTVLALGIAAYILANKVPDIK
jgi:hypothetical protein